MDRIKAALPERSSCLVIEDAAHDYSTTRAALESLAELVPAGGCFVVEDGHVDVPALRLDEGWPIGVHRAIDEWLTTPAGSEFAMRRELELYGLTTHPRGFLERRR